MSTELESGPLPDDIRETVASIMREEGVNYLTSKILRQRLAAKYNIEFASHKAALERIVADLMQLPEFKRQLENAVMKAENTAKKNAANSKKRSSDTKESVSNAKKTKKEKKPENFPKKALSSYFFFLNDQREKIKAENPDTKTTEIAHLVGKMWAEASDVVKAKYKKLADADKERYDRELSEYKKNGGADFKRGGNKKKTKDKDAPKRSISAYIFFSNDFRTKHPELSVTELSKAAGAAWKGLSDEMKKPYEAMALKDKERYQREIAARENQNKPNCTNGG